MVSLKLAKKQAKQNKKRYVKNLARKTNIKTAIKKVLVALEHHESSEKLATLLRDAEAKLARAKNKNLLHASTVSRKVSNLAKKVAMAIKQQKQAA